MDALAANDIVQITADNHGPFPLRGTNTWLVGRDPCFLIDPGPADAGHRERILSDARDRGGIGGVPPTPHHPPPRPPRPGGGAAAGAPPPPRPRAPPRRAPRGRGPPPPPRRSARRATPPT